VQLGTIFLLDNLSPIGNNMKRDTKERTVEFLVTNTGKCPFELWLNSIDSTMKLRIKRKLTRTQQGNLGNWKPVGDGIFEFRYDFGPGYRVYFAFYRDKMIVVLGGGTKRTQNKDIKKAEKLWKEYKNETKKFR